MLAVSTAFGAQLSRIPDEIDGRVLATIHGNVHPRALAEFDQGRLDGDVVLRHLSIVLKPSASQRADLDKFLLDQQDSASPEFHHWLTPEQYAERFGVSNADVAKMSAWLQLQGFTVDSAARGRNTVSFTGTAAQVENAFHTELRRYTVDGKSHFANATDPMLPAALAPVVTAIHGLHDFRMVHPRLTSRRIVAHGAVSHGENSLAPADFATIYNLTPLYDAGIDGTGQKLVVVGQTQIRPTEIQTFRSAFGLAANAPTVLLVPNTTDPGEVSDDLDEAHLDIELSGAVARKAELHYVYASDVMTAMQYAIDQNIAPVVSISYGSCEAQNSASDTDSLRTWAKQASTQGITLVAASGDSGALDCYSGNVPTAGGATVDLPAGLPEVTGVGGTELYEGSGNYWSPVSVASASSALGYIPEIAWNDSAFDDSPSASGGGASVNFAKPSWQVGAGVPPDNARDVPDIALASSADHDGFQVYTKGNWSVFGGTSVASPSFAGIVALLNHYQVQNGYAASGAGNINPRLYAMAQSTPSAFHDILTGTNLVTPCTSTSRNCSVKPVGFNAGPGYDLVTGLGSIDAYKLVTNWHGNAVPIPPAAPAPSIAGMTNAASFQQSYAPGMIMSVFGTKFSTGTAAASVLPLPVSLVGVTATVNGLPAPLYYAAPGQINLQIPYETPVSAPVSLVVNANGQTVTASLTLSSAAPGIFTDANGAPVPFASATRGQIITLFITGEGAVTPSVATGATPAATSSFSSLPHPVQFTSVTVGGLPATLTFVGIPPGLAGATQINYQVPGGVATGSQPVVVTVGNVQSKPAYLTVQ